MSEVKLNLIDTQQVLHGKIHGSAADAAVAALSAEPETIAELQAALARYIKPRDDSGPFQSFRSAAQIDADPWDAGIVIIDLTTRIVAVESSYSQPQPEGEVHYHDGTKSTDITVLYRLPDDWLFVNSVEAYRWSPERRGKERLAKTSLDVREVLYGTPLLEFIVDEVSRVDISEAAANGEGTISDGSDSNEPTLSRELSAIHSRWLLTPSQDLCGGSPRDVMLAKQDFIDFDLHTRELQWTFQGEGPPCLAKDSQAYRFAGFGTHEWVIYYDLVRHLLWCAADTRGETSVCGSNSSPKRELSALSGQAEIAGRSAQGLEYEENAPTLTNIKDNTESNLDAVAYLEQLETDWLERPQPDLEGRIPAIIIENERQRLPLALRPRDMIIDEDCLMCQMFGDETTPLGMGVGFWHLDGSSMDDDFAFSSYKTRAEWEAENRRREEFNEEFNRRWEERQQRIARGEQLEPDPFFDPDPFPDLEFDGSNTELSDDDGNELPQ